MRLWLVRRTGHILIAILPARVCSKEKDSCGYGTISNFLVTR